MNSGGGQAPTQTTQTQSAGSGLLNLIKPGLKKFVDAGPVLPDQSYVAPFNPAQTSGQSQVLSAASGPQQHLADSGANASDFLLGASLHPSSNPALQEYMNTAAQPISDQLTHSTLPAIRGSAVTAGQFGGSRQGIAEGLASQGTSRAIASSDANIANAGYAQGLDSFTKALGLLPQTTNLQTVPGLTTSGVGDVQQALQQALLGEQSGRWSYENQFPLVVGQQIAGIASAFPGGTSTTTGTAPQSNPINQAIGGASALGGLLAFL